MTEAHAIIDWLSGRGPFCDEEYVHFTRQIDYVDLDGRRVVGEVFAVEDMSAFAARLSVCCGIAFNSGRRENTSLVSNNPLLGAARLAKPIYKRLTRWKDRERILRWIRRSQTADKNPFYDRILEDPKIERFIELFYAEDFLLHRSAMIPRSG